MTTLRTDSTHSGITIDYADGSAFVHGGSGPLTVYSDDEKAAINALTDADNDTYYLFLVNSVTKLDANGNRTIVSGYMPVGYQHGFIFEQFDVARTIAHELSHGAFALHHTFSANTESFRADEGTTTNLMDYTEHGIALNHKQWRWMHENHGKGLFGFLADEEEGALVDKGTTLAITFGKLNDDFEPGKKDLSIEYSIENIEDIAKEHKDAIKAFLWIIKDKYTELDKDTELLYATDLPLKNTNTVKWNGKSNQGEVETEIDDLSDFTIKIGVTIEYDHSIVNIIEWLFTPNVDFKLSSEKEKKWSVLKWEKDFKELEKKSMQQADKEKFYENKNKYEARLEELGVNTTETTPLEYLNEHLVAGDFLGKEIPCINIRFLYFLRKLEEELGRKKEWSKNEEPFITYYNLAPKIEDYARMSAVGESLSDHATGFAIDFAKDENPWFTTDKNIQQDKFIQIVTGVKLLNNQYRLSAATIKKASDDFLERIKGNDFDIDMENLQNIYDNIADYSKKISLLNQEKTTEYNDSVSAAASKIDGFVVKTDQDISQDELETQKQNLLNDIKPTNEKFKSLNLDLDTLKLLFDASKSGLFINYDMGNNYEQLYCFINDYKEKTDAIIKCLEKIETLSTSSAFDWNKGITDLKNNVSSISFGSGYQSHLTDFSKKFNEKIGILGDEIKKFPKKLQEETAGLKDYRGRKLFEKGFCSLDASLVEDITTKKVTLNNTKMNLLWGGIYTSSKDIMHFELRKAPKSDRQYQKAVHGIDMKEIKEYLNSFNKKDGGNYDY